MAVYQTATATFADAGDVCGPITPGYANSVFSITQADGDDQRVQLQIEQGGVGSGSWRTVKEWNRSGSDNDFTTVADTYFHRSKDRIRLFLHTDNGGSNAVVLSEENDTRARIKANDIELTFDKFDADNGAYKPKVGGNVVAETASFTANGEKHANRITTLDASGGALTVTLPSSTGSLDEYTFLSIVDPGTNDIVISCDADGGAFLGAIHVMTDGSAPTPFASDQSGNDLITLNNTTTGGLGVGDWITVKDVGTNLWMVWGQVVSSGAEATPFSGS